MVNPTAAGRLVLVPLRMLLKLPGVRNLGAVDPMTVKMIAQSR